MGYCIAGYHTPIELVQQQEGPLSNVNKAIFSLVETLYWLPTPLNINPKLGLIWVLSTCLTWSYFPLTLNTAAALPLFPFLKHSRRLLS